MKPVWDVYCVICGGPPRSDDSRCPAGQSGATRISTDWLDDWVGVTPEQPEQPISIGKYDSYGCWETRKGRKFAAYGEWANSIAPNERKHNRLYGPPDTCGCSPADLEDDDEEYYSWYDGEPAVVCPAHAPKPGLHWLEDWRGDSDWVRYGVAFHRSCGQLLQQRLGYSLNFNHVWPLLRQQKCNTNHLNRSYGGTERYHGMVLLPGMYEGAWFLHSHVSAADEYMLLDPLQCSGNADRIVRVWEPLVQQFQRAERRDKTPARGPQSASKGKGESSCKGTGRGRGRGAAVGVSGKGGRGRAGRGGDSAAAAPAADAGGRNRNQAQARRVTRRAAARERAEDIAACVLPLVFSHAGSPKDQLALAAQLLPLSSTMPQLLAGRMQLAVAANTWSRVQQVAGWLRRCGCLVRSLDLDAVVDCCDQDASRANAAVLDAITTTAANFQGFRLLSLSAYVPDSSARAASKLLRSLPLTRLTALHLTGPWALSAQAAAALTAATALQELTLPGGGLGEALAAHPAVLLTGLQHLRLSDAGTCSADTLGALSGQLTALTHLALDYSPWGGAGVVMNLHDNSFSSILQEVQECWAELPALRSLAVGAKRVRQQPRYGDTFPGEEHWLGNGDPPVKLYLEVDGDLLDSIAALTALTSLTLGPSAWLQAPPDVEESGLDLLLPPLQELTELQQLGLTLQVSFYWEQGDAGLGDDQCAVMQAVAELPQLQDLTVSDSMCGDHIWCLDEAAELTRLEFVHPGMMACSTADAVRKFGKKWPDLAVVWDKL